MGKAKEKQKKSSKIIHFHGVTPTKITYKPPRVPKSAFHDYDPQAAVGGKKKIKLWSGGKK